MARTMGMDALEQKISNAQAKVVWTKASYEKAVDDLQILLDKRTALRNDEMIKAAAISRNSYEEIMLFITEE